MSRAQHVPRFIGNSGQALAVPEPRRFFALLDNLGVAHPHVRFTLPKDLNHWLVKRSDGCGGTHIELASGIDHLPEHAYFQRLAQGRSMSELFLAAHREAKVIGFASQLTIEAGRLPFVHAGYLGPVELPPSIAGCIVKAIESIVWKTDLMGLNSIDFLLDGDIFDVLEINARPSSTRVSTMTHAMTCRCPARASKRACPFAP